MFERILVPLDGSELSDRIVAQLRRLLVVENASVRLVQVVPQAVGKDARSGPAAVEAASAHLAQVAKPLRDGGAEVTTDVLLGEPAARLLELMKEWKPSVVALATHGRSGVARWVRGSTAERLVRTSPVPLFLANPRGLEKPGELQVKRILVPLDGSEHSAEILPLVDALAKRFEAQVTLFFVVELIASPGPVAVPTLMTTEEAGQMLEPFRRRVTAPGTQVRVTLGAPASSIVDEAERGKYDLVALTTHGRSGLARWAFGSVAEHVLRQVTCPLLVKRSLPGPEAAAS